MKSALEQFQRSIVNEYREESTEFELNESDFEIPEITEEIISASADNTFSGGAARSLYDFFDRNGVYIGVTPTDDKKWTYFIPATSPEESNVISEKEYNNRSEAEIGAFIMGFKTLENIL